MLSPKMKKNATYGLVTLFLLAAGYWYWERTKVEVEISTYFKDATILLGEASSGQKVEPDWFEVKAGKTRLHKGAYFFKVQTSDRERVGLIAVNDATPIVLK